MKMNRYYYSKETCDSYSCIIHVDYDDNVLRYWLYDTDDTKNSWKRCNSRQRTRLSRFSESVHRVKVEIPEERAEEILFMDSI